MHQNETVSTGCAWIIEPEPPEPRSHLKDTEKAPTWKGAPKHAWQNGYLCCLFRPDRCDQLMRNMDPSRPYLGKTHQAIFVRVKVDNNLASLVAPLKTLDQLSHRCRMPSKIWRPWRRQARMSRVDQEIWVDSDNIILRKNVLYIYKISLHTVYSRIHYNCICMIDETWYFMIFWWNDSWQGRLQTFATSTRSADGVAVGVAISRSH